MFKNFFKTAVRNLLQSKGHSLINIMGLSVGLAVAILIGLWIDDEISFNKNFSHYDRIAQVIQNVTNNGEVQTWRDVPYPLGEELRKNYGSDFTQVITGITGNFILRLNDDKIKELGSFYEPGLPGLLSLNMVRGNRGNLDDPSSILLSASAAKAFFGEGDPINKIMNIGDFPVVKVTGVYDDFPHNSTFAGVNFLGAWKLWFNNSGATGINDPWRPNFAQVLVQLADHADIRSASMRIRDAKLRKVNAQLAKKKPELFLDPMSQWHLHSEFKDGKNAGGGIQYVWMFGTIGAFVLLLACINFMNLSTARSEKRAREVGIRKTLGSMRSQLILQFFNESLLTVVFAFGLSLILVRLALPFFNEVADKQMIMPLANPAFWGMCIAVIAVTALVAGSYPALYLSGFQPVRVLKGTFKAGRMAAIPRQVLVVLQFSVSVTLIIGTIIVYRQILFAKDRPVGYTRAGIVSIPVSNSSIHDHFKAVKDELMRTGAVAGVTESSSAPTDIAGSTSGFSWEGKDPNLSIDFGQGAVSADYGKLIGWHVAEGRDFNKDFATDSAASASVGAASTRSSSRVTFGGSIILNHAAIKFMGRKNPVGARTTWFGQPYTVIGVVDDMVMGSPYDEVHPIIFSLLGPKDAGNVVLIKISPGASAESALGKIAPVFRKFNPEQPFEYRFADDDYARKFSDEARIGELAGCFAVLAVLISCLGLFGLTSFIAEQRKKEIGVRKVLGASVLNIWNLLSTGFIRLVMISFLISIPVSYYLMQGWLQNYHYRAALSWWIFVAAGGGAMAITMAVVSFQAIKAAVSNPIRSLRSDG